MLKNTRYAYGAVAKLLHWSVALLIIGLIALGAYMVELNYYHKWYNATLEWHKALGMIALALGVAKVAWMSYSPGPELPEGLFGWQRGAARAMHHVLLAMMVLIPITGYVISTSAGQPVSVFGWVDVPALLPRSERLRDLAIDLHYWLAYATALLVTGHASAALKHQFIDRDGTLGRML